jgi:hypothetical protein
VGNEDGKFMDDGCYTHCTLWSLSALSFLVTCQHSESTEVLQRAKSRWERPRLSLAASAADVGLLRHGRKAQLGYRSHGARV